MTSAVAAVGEGNAPVRPVRGVGERHDAADFVPPRVRVALGIDGTYWNSPFAWNAPACKGFKDMRKGALLEALAASRRFAVTLKDVALNQCTVTIMSAVAGEEPTVDEEKDGVQLRLGNTVGMLAKNCPRLFIRVRLPEAQAQGMVREQTFCAAMLSATESTIEHDCRLITLAGSNNSSWPGLKSKELFIRREFDNIYELLAKAGWKESSISGTPGIGKSSLGMYLFWRLAKEGKTVIYTYNKGGLKSMAIRNRNMIEVDDVRMDEDAIFICDGKDPFMFETPVKKMLATCRTVAIFSPRCGLLNEWAKQCPPERRLFLPLPSFEVLLEMRNRCFPGLPDAEITERARIWGPVPRTVLLLKEDRIRAHILLEDQNMDQLFRYAGRSGFDSVSFPSSGISSRILTPVVDPLTYQSTGVRFISDYFARAALRTASAAGLEPLYTQLAHILLKPVVLSINHPFFEQWAMDRSGDAASRAPLPIRRIGTLSTTVQSEIDAAYAFTDELLEVTLDEAGLGSWQPKERAVKREAVNEDIKHGLRITGKDGVLHLVEQMCGSPAGKGKTPPATAILWFVPAFMFDDFPLQIHDSLVPKQEIPPVASGEPVHVQYAVKVPNFSTEELQHVLSSASSRSGKSSISNPSTSGASLPGTNDSARMPLAKMAPFYAFRCIERVQQLGLFPEWRLDAIMPTRNVLSAIRASQQIRQIQTLASIRKVFK